MKRTKPIQRFLGVTITVAAFLTLGSSLIVAQGRPSIPEWKPNPSATTAPEPNNSNQLPAFSLAAAPADQSDELVLVDKELATNIGVNGPLKGYGAYISDQGVLYDAAGGSPEGQAAAAARFGSFPANITMERRPEKAMASGGAGASWGAYSVKRGDTMLSDGRYVTIWRKEPSGWKIVSELAAGRNAAPPALPAKPVAPSTAPIAPATGVGALPKMRDALGRPIGTRAPQTNPN